MSFASTVPLISENLNSLLFVPLIPEPVVGTLNSDLFWQYERDQTFFYLRFVIFLLSGERTLLHF